MKLNIVTIKHEMFVAVTGRDMPERKCLLTPVSLWLSESALFFQIVRFIFGALSNNIGARGSVVDKELCYKQEGHEFET
jgi:hypothetical protein